MTQPAPLIVHSFAQGSPEWKEHRYGCNNASDGGAMLSCDDNRSRTDVLHAMFVGFSEDVSDYKQKIFDGGHAVEAAARPIAEQIVGEDLYPLVVSRKWPGLSRPLGGSCDGLTMARHIDWECKQLNELLRDALPHVGPDDNDAANLPKKHRLQMEQRMMIHGATQCLFTAAEVDRAGNVTDARHCWYVSDPELRAELVAGWIQFEADLAAYEPRAIKEMPKGVRGESLGLPAVVVRGQVVSSDLASWRERATQWLATINTDLKTDEDFGQADADAKLCRETSDKLILLRDQVLGQMADVNQVVTTLEQIAALTTRRAIDLENDVTRRKTEIRTEIASAGMGKLVEHITALDERLSALLPAGTARSIMPAPTHPKIEADFSKAIKGKRTVKTLHDAVDAELARAKIAASALADAIEKNLRHLVEHAKAHNFLFADWKALVFKDHDDFTVQVKARIDAHEAEQARQREAAAQREREAEERRQREATAAQEAQARAASAPSPTASPAPAAAPAQREHLTLTPEGDAVRYTTPAVVPMRRGVNIAQKATLTVGAVCARIGDGCTLTRDFINRTLGVPGTPGERAGTVMFTENDFDLILESLKAHATTLQAKHQAAA